MYYYTSHDNYYNHDRYYIGIQPVIAVKDLEMLKQIMVKQFDTFTDKRVRYYIAKIFYNILDSAG